MWRGREVMVSRTTSLPEMFSQEYVGSCRFNFWDTLDHPVGMLLVVSTREPDVVTRRAAVGGGGLGRGLRRGVF